MSEVSGEGGAIFLSTNTSGATPTTHHCCARWTDYFRRVGRDSNPSNPHPQRFESVESKIIESCPPLVSSLSVALNSQAKASFVAAEYLKQKRRETYVSHLPSHTHDSVRYALLSSKSSSFLFADEVIEKSFGQVKDDSQLQLLKNLSSQKGSKGSASSSSSSAQSHSRSVTAQPSSYSRSSGSSMHSSRGS